MQKRQYITLLLVALFIFISFLSLNIMLKNIPINEDYYSLDRKGMGKTIAPIVRLENDGKYFIHPATKADAKATFSFNKDNKLLWHFSIQDGSPCGKIKFILKKNGEDFKKFIVDTNLDKKLDIKVRNGDKITVIANPNGSTAGDWGNLKISRYEPNYTLKLILIPVVWFIFFIYLINKGYVYIAINSYFGFILTLVAEKLTSGALLFVDIAEYTIFFFLFAFLFVLIYQELKKFKKYKIATLLKLITTIIIYMIPTSFIVFFLTFNKPIDWNILFAIYQTNFSESIDFIKSFIPTSYLFVVVVFVLIMGYIFWHQERKEREVIERSLLILLIILLTVFISESFLKTRLPNLIYTTFSEYSNQIERLMEFQEKRKSSKIKFTATKKEKGEVYVVVIGESLNKYNMSLYGYFRNTTPKQLKQVKEDNLLVFKNAYSNAGNTMRSLSYALTEANQYNGKSHLESLSFIDTFNKAGFKTFWLSTQDIFGENNTLVSVLAQSSNRVIDLTSKVDPKTGATTYFDENAIDELKKRVSNSENTLIIIHLYGNHFHYQDRYPKEFTKFKKAKPYLIGTDKDYILEDYSAYDNSVYYNDYVVSSLLDVLKEHGGISAFLYFSDHAEDIAKHRGHTSRPESFTFAMSQIPLTAWLSPEYIKRYNKTYKALIDNKDKLFSNDMIYDTILGLAHIKTDRYNPVYDLSSPKYYLNPKKAMTLHGGLHYISPKNYYYWREYNTKLLKNKNLIDKIVITNIDNVGKLNEAWQLGYRTFEVKLKYIDTKKSFQIGINKFDSKGNLIDLLSFFNVKQIKNLFLNMINLNQTNIKEVLNRLENINNKLNIKDKTTLIINNFKLAKDLKQQGWSITVTSSNSNNLEYIDYILVDTKMYKQLIDKNNIIVNSSYNIADNKLENKTNEIEKYNKDNRIKFLFVNFTSAFDK